MQTWHNLTERFSQLQQREKLMLWGGSLLVTLWLAINYLLHPMWQNQQKAQLQMQNMQRQQQEMQQQVVELQQQLTVDLDSDYHQRIKQLQQQQQQLNNQIQHGVSSFIAAEQMISLLQNLLQSSSTVQVKSLGTDLPHPVRLQGQASDEPALLFQHKLNLVMVGEYISLYKVLQSMEQLPWLVNWSGLHYQVTTYPQAELTIELSTVSENEDFIRL